MAKDMYVQCRMQREVAEGVASTVSYIPAKIAETGRTVRLKEENGEWSEGWLIVGCGGMKSKHEIDKQHQNLKKQRQASDI